MRSSLAVCCDRAITIDLTGGLTMEHTTDLTVGPTRDLTFDLAIDATIDLTIDSTSDRGLATPGPSSADRVTIDRGLATPGPGSADRRRRAAAVAMGQLPWGDARASQSAEVSLQSPAVSSASLASLR